MAGVKDGGHSLSRCVLSKAFVPHRLNKISDKHLLIQDRIIYRIVNLNLKALTTWITTLNINLLTNFKHVKPNKVFFKPKCLKEEQFLT